MITLGWLGAIMLAVCGIPQAVKSIRDGHSDGVDSTFLALWTTGEILSLVYVMSLGDLPLVVNYVANTIACLIIAYFKWRTYVRV